MTFEIPGMATHHPQNHVRTLGTISYDIPEETLFEKEKHFYKIRHTWSHSGQNHVHTKTKYKSHSRNSPIGQPHNASDFGSGTSGCVYFS